MDNKIKETNHLIFTNRHLAYMCQLKSEQTSFIELGEQIL